MFLVKVTPLAWPARVEESLLARLQDHHHLQQRPGSLLPFPASLLQLLLPGKRSGLPLPS